MVGLSCSSFEALLKSLMEMELEIMTMIAKTNKAMEHPKMISDFDVLIAMDC